MKHDFDVAIVGGGPAGSACAIAASRLGLRVALFEAQSSLSDKPCGEGLMPPGVDALRDLGMHDVVLAGRSFDTLRYVLPLLDPLELAMPRPGLAIDRPRLMQGFEDALRGMSDITRVAGHVRAERMIARDGVAGFRMTCGGACVDARVLVAADGLHGKTAPWLRAASTPKTRASVCPRRIGLRARYVAAEKLDAVEIHFSRGTEVYLTPLPNHIVNVVVLVNSVEGHAGGADSILECALAEHPRVVARLGERTTDARARVLGGVAPQCVARAGAFLVGDAGGGIDPILGCGVTLALESGILAASAARVIVNGQSSGAVEREYVREYRRRTRTRRALASFLLALANRPRVARGTVELVRLTPKLLGWLVNIAAGANDRKRTTAQFVRS